MNLLIRHIEYLASRNDCVIIPEFGAVLVQYQKAEYDSDAELFLPPRRNFAFNAALTHNDGLLACSIARSEQISYDEANEIISQQVENLKKSLHEHKIFPLGRIGMLHYDNTISFTPFEYDSISALTSALLPFKLARRCSQAVVEAPAPPVYVQRVRQSRSSWNMAVRIAASLLVLFTVCLIASTPMTFDQAAMASLSPQLRQTTLDEIIPKESHPDYLVAYTANPEGIYIDVPQRTCASDAKYFIIVASFATQEDAQKYIEQSGDQSLGILVKDGRHRIYAASAATQAQAYSLMPSISQKYSQTWICSK